MIGHGKRGLQARAFKPETLRTVEQMKSIIEESKLKALS